MVTTNSKYNKKFEGRLEIFVANFHYKRTYMYFVILFVR